MIENAEDLLTPRLVTIGADEIFAPLPPANYICQELDICPGAPTMVAGYGYSGKTTASMSLALEVALHDRVVRAEQARSGPLGVIFAPPKAWGHASILRGGRVLHLDYEMGNRLVREKYQRLLRGHPSGATVDDLRGLLEAVILPTVYLDQPETEAVLAKMCEGVVLCLIDSLRACAPSVEENSSDVRRVLDMLTRISEATGCVFLVVHHSRKTNEANGKSAAQSLRGSSAIYDACASVLVFTGEKNMPSKVQHEKARNRGICADDFSIAIQDVKVGADERGGLRVVVAKEPTVDACVPDGWNDAESELTAKMMALLLSKDIESKTSLVAQVPGNKQTKFALAAQLYENKIIFGKLPIRVTETAKNKTEETLGRVLDQFSRSISLRQLQQMQGWEHLRTVRPVDGGASISSLRRWLARDGLDIYVRAAVDKGGREGKLSVNGDNAKLVGWAELPDAKFGLCGVPVGSMEVPVVGTNQVPSSPPLRGGTGIGVVPETHQVPLPGNLAAPPPSAPFAQPPLDLSVPPQLVPGPFVAGSFASQPVWPPPSPSPSEVGAGQTPAQPKLVHPRAEQGGRRKPPRKRRPAKRKPAKHRPARQQGQPEQQGQQPKLSASASKRAKKTPKRKEKP